jgi:hypothetical protein
MMVLGPPRTRTHEYAWVGLESLERHFPEWEVSRAVMRDVVVDVLKGFAEE